MLKQVSRSIIVCCISFATTISCAIILYAQAPHVQPHAPDILWTRTFGRPGHDDVGNSVRETSDGGLIIAGSSYDYNSYLTRVYLVRTNSFGDTLWTKTYGATGWSVGNAVRETPDGGFLIAGTTSRSGGGTIVYLVRTDTSGDSLWARTYGSSEFQEGDALSITSDGGCIIAGNTTVNDGTQNAFFVRTNASGDTLWTRNTGYVPDDPNDQGVYSVCETSNGDFIATGYTGPTLETNEDVYLVKLDSLGNELWSSKYGGPWNDWGKSIIETSGGDYLIAGTRENYYGVEYSDVWLIDTDTNGSVQWSKTYGGTGSQGGNSIDETRDGHYVVAGGSSGDIYLLETDSDGNSTWSTTLGPITGNSVQQASDGGYVAAGYTMVWGFEYVYLIKIAPDIGVHGRTPSRR